MSWSARRLPIAAGLALVLLVALTLLVEAGHLAPLAFDRAVHSWTLDHRTPALTRVAVVVTDSGVGPVAYLLAAAAGGVIGRARHWTPAWAGVVIGLTGLIGVQLLRQGLVQSIGRPRPPHADWATTASGLSFPSGHTTTSATVAALLCVALLSTGRSAGHQIGVALAILWAVAVGLTRVYLGVHWPTDVLAGWLLAATLVLGAATVLNTRGFRRP